MIDKVDKKILSILQENSRSSSSYIAKKTNLSTPTIIERIKKMTDAGVKRVFGNT